MVKSDYEAKGTGKKKGIFSSLFPRQYDFEQMLVDQANRTLEGVCTLVFWLKKTPHEEPVNLQKIEGEVDTMRHEMEIAVIGGFFHNFVYTFVRIVRISYVLRQIVCS